ncbi:BSD domain containing protein [Pyrenophora tritici-repentis]|nr:BSD domain containing protein [Pyrenophora tritici-repentis]KAI1536683.1 BSD domain containing protein [Pyrenophora tritici-repentis]KAI1547412.1 BSD domain containing protein [Pyrenophora tritici-repentis]KAI1570509.1 BSD domain containing protein [Pyrenophora tritici-repentis]KAI1588552.1 BSD domain containing protein [Pyrenophora tritici-repentis]
MDSAYDHIQEESYPEDPTKQSSSGDSTHQETATNFNTEFQDAYKAISSSPWAARLGGFLGTVKKQGEQYYDTASKQYAPLTKNASESVSNIISHARKISLQPGDASSASKPTNTDKDASIEETKEEIEAHPDRPESLTADIVKEAEGILSRFRNIRNFLRDAVTIAPPESGSEADKNGEVLFESKDSSGKKVVHATRFDAQLHVIHSTLDSFLKDPASPEWEKWQAAFDVDKKTDAIAKDLEKHEELRSAMEKCVPERVDYKVFWRRYYFLRHVIESEEARRREMLKDTKTPAAAQPRRSNDEKSVADSDASYDLVSGATSRAPGSPQDGKKKTVAEESDEEEDWE